MRPSSAFQVVFNPGLAEIFLKWLSPQQRQLQERIVRIYELEMRNGKWQEDENNSPVTIDSDGYLVNGQHRLHAVVRSGVHLKLWVRLESDGSIRY